MSTETQTRSGQQLIKDARSRIEEIDPSQVNEILEAARSNGSADDAPVILDVREQQEFEQGYIPGAVHVPRGHLETRIEQARPGAPQARDRVLLDRNRSALAAITMKEMLGYEESPSMTGGFTLWKDRGTRSTGRWS